MQYVYILKSKKDNKMYIGCTNNLQNRLSLHNGGKVSSTRLRVPFELVFYEAFRNKKDAFAREQWLKTGWGRNHVQKMLHNEFKSLGGLRSSNCG
jgi:putative endonuclease